MTMEGRITHEHKPVMSRFRVERRVGIVAVYDIQHPEYCDTPGCQGSYPWCVAYWMGAYNTFKGYWDIDQWKIERANALAERLNTQET